MTRWLLLLGTLVYSAWLLEFVLPTDLSLLHSYVSEHMASDQPYRFLFRTTDVIAGTLFVAAAFSLRDKLVGIGLAVFGGVTVLDALVPMDCAPSIDRACRQREIDNTVSLSHEIHQASSVLVFCGIFTAVIGLLVLRETLGPQGRFVLWTCFAVLALSGLLSALLVGGPWVGLVQRAQLVATDASLVLTIVILTRTPRLGR
ncbi:DUF998 domain-containing protein [Allokutzneria sp. A3M-2-11 16]|uniref:DUF998 domain-containing protein n=1 Tax=Allokutzneria sp. A3M-2-11 16 TaxID=2962043 RepID=UPI0020B82C15|nr:DUF998 domain-containing protein [Allokutzneria sp. A3M-2-11 16]MCP3803662.1 DUF998 domain-containing protein [Allokutzneria sp. A3M-2-11 16]